MSTARSRAITTTQAIHRAASTGEQCPVRVTPADIDPFRNRVEHYGALGVIFDQGIDSLMNNEVLLAQLHMCSSVAQLRRHYTDALSVSMQQALIDNPTIYDELTRSQSSRVTVNPNVWGHVEQSIDAGAQTAVNTIEATYELLSDLFGNEAAHHSSNSAIVDKMAKLNIDHMTLYRDVYVESSENQTEARNHFTYKAGESIKWAQGFPGNAPIPVALSKPKRIISRADLSLSQECIPLKDISTTFPETIGCPITFTPASIRNLWTLYLECISQVKQQLPYKLLRAKLALHALDGITHPDDTAE